MAWVVDTCILIDIAESDPNFGILSAQLLDSKRQEGLTICPITFIEISPVFKGNVQAQDEFLSGLGIDSRASWTFDDTLASHEAWNSYVLNKRAGAVRKRPISDILIGAFATRFNGLFTRNEADFKDQFPNLILINPTVSPLTPIPGQSNPN